MRRTKHFFTCCNFSCFLTVAVICALLQSSAIGETFKSPLVVLTGSSPIIVGQGDFDRDGDPDIAYLDASGAHILLSQGNGTFVPGQKVAVPLGLGTMTIADVNDDGKLDLLFGGSNPQATIGVTLGNGDGTFAAVVVSSFSLNLNLFSTTTARFGVADFDGDGAADIVAADAQNGVIFVLSGTNTAAFTLKTVIPDFSGPRDVFTADFNGDGHEDFLVRGGLGASVTVYLGKGDGTFQPGVTYGGAGNGITSLVLADMDGDGHQDLVVGTQSNNIQILHGNPDGTFATTSSGGAILNSFPIVLAVGDFNSDGIPDIAFSNDGGLSILLGKNNLSYSAPVSYGIAASSSTTTLADLNRDGHSDFVLAVPGGLAILLGKAQGTFQSFDVYDVGQPATAITTGDFNGDHIADLAVASQGAGPTVLLGKGDGTFKTQATTPVAGGTWSVVLSGDFNGDGKADLYFTTNNSAGVVLFGNGNATFGPPLQLTGFQQAGFVAAASADFNGDGRTDLMSTNYESFDVLLGQSNKTFKLVQSNSPGLSSSVSPAIGDFNKDGHMDPVIGGTTTMQVLLGNGDGSFTTGRTISTQLPGHDNLCDAQSIATADLDGDGNLDLVATISFPYVAEIFYGHGNGIFDDPVVLPFQQDYTQVAVADLNGDHIPDLIFSNENLIAIVHGVGNRNFSSETHYLAGGIGNLVIQDFNGDGAPDIGVASLGTTVAVLLNLPGGNLTTGKLTIQPEPSVFMASFSMNLSLAPLTAGSANPTGIVTFSIDDNPAGTVHLSGASASFTYQTAAMSVGSHTISALYNGDASFVPGYFIAQHRVVPIMYPTSITVTANPTTVMAGRNVSFRAKITSPGQTPYGKVSFQDGTTTLGAVSLDGNSLAVFDTALLSAGTHAIKAYYLGNENFAPVTSAAVTIVVNVVHTATTLTVNPTTVAANTPILLTAVVSSSSGAPTGSVIFYDGSTFLQNTALDGNGVASYGTSFAAGAHALSAVYLANGGFASSTSATINTTVTANVAANWTSTNLSAQGNPAVARGFIFTASVATADRKPTGNVVFLDGNSRIGEVSLNESGSGVYATNSLSPGVHYISAFYPGNSKSAPSVSTVIVERLPDDTPDFSIAMPSSKLVLDGVSTSTLVDVRSINGFSENVILACSIEDPRLSCSLDNPNISAGSGTAKLTITRIGTEGRIAAFGSASLLKIAAVFMVPILCFSFLGSWERKRQLRAVTVLALASLLASCSLRSVSNTALEERASTATVTGVARQTPSEVIHKVALEINVAPH